MKLRVNDPCHCGSGRKYKKCCMHKPSQGRAMGLPDQHPMKNALETLLSADTGLPSAAPHLPPPRRPTSGISQDALPAMATQTQQPTTQELPKWPGLPKGGKAFVTREDESGWLRREHIAFQSYISQCAASPSAAMVGVQLLDSIPEKDAMRLEWFGAAKAYLLELLNQREAALFSQLSQMIHANDEYLWFAWGVRGLQWLQTYPNAPQREKVLASLAEIAAQGNACVPSMLLAFVRWGHDPTNVRTHDTVEAMQQSLQADAWPWQHKRFMRKEGAARAWGEWLAAISDGLSRLLLYLHQHGEPEALEQTARECLAFPWRRLLPKFQRHSLRALAGALAHVGQHEPLERLCQRFAEWMPTNPVLHIWLGLSYQKQGEIGQAQAQFQQARDGLSHPSQLTEVERVCLIEDAFARRSPEDADELLPSLQHQESPAVQRLHYWYRFLRQEHERSLEHLEQWLAKQPRSFEAIARHIRTLDIMGENDELATTLRRYRPDPNPQLRQFAHIYSGIYAAMNGDWHKATALFDTLPQELASGVFLDDALFTSSYLSCRAYCFERQQQWSKARALYQKAIALYPLDWACGRLFSGMAQHEQWDDVADLLPKVLETSEEFVVRLIEIRLYLHQQSPEEARQGLELLGRDAFVQRARSREWLWLWMRIYIDLNSPHEALRLCELHLHEILEDETLRALRSQLFDDVMQRFEWLEFQHGQQAQELEQTEALRQRLDDANLESQRRANALQDALSEQDALRDELHRLQRQSAKQTAIDEEFQRWLAAHEALLEGLAPNERQLTSNAEHMWQQLAQRPEDDHGPVVLQLARAVEGEVNRRLIDPLVAYTLSEDTSLKHLPSITLGRLKPKRNRVSLGDACKLLHHKYEQREHDGSISIRFNPLSNDTHKTVLEGFWSTPARAEIADNTKHYLRNGFIEDTRLLASLRNKASHAGRLLDRETIERARKLVLGSESEDGILHHLIKLPTR